ncbi:hypothetical protein FEM48_Zijuj01G0132900 [Ziziphus jujuba var. spinosa]|uniref:Gnk2-homologous domain-containing protein n=1 Tax=Ziziphus jujuba var. spinosa TaxID=714518 RepID=A0A978W1H2_ZIZJJ|nr:hypothetical protein FEM48_Zijuj01G0132900 [Ziziphus jujuba var. spinosa]
MANFQGLVKPIPLLSLYLLLALLSYLAYADPPYQLCPNNTSIYANNTPFQKNLNNLLQSLVSNASASKFFNTTSGNYPDKVFGSYMCLNYVTNQSCQDCMVTASQAIVSLCPQMKEAVVYEEVCQLRYSNRNFFGQLNVSGNIGKGNHFNISEPEKFKSVVNKTLQNLTKEAAFNLSAKMYAVGHVPYTDRTLFRTLYALVQCATDLSANDCDICLLKAIEDILYEYYFSIGARLLSRSCYLRYELYGFYNGETEADTNFTSAPNARKKEEGGGKTQKITIIASVAAFVAIVFLGSCFYFYGVSKTNRKNSSDSSVYGQALCRGYIGFEACKVCIQSASQEILNTCKTYDGIIWYEHCQVRYSFRLFSLWIDNSGKYPHHNSLEKNVSDPVRFEKELMDLMSSLSKQTVSDPSKRMFASGETKFSDKKIIYGLSQCTRDLSPDSCDNCLQETMGDLQSCYSSHECGIVLSKGYNVRFELYRFYNLASKRGFKWKIWTVLVVIGASTLVAAVVFVCYAAYLRSNRLQQEDKSQQALMHDLASSTVVTITQDGNFMSSEKLQFVDLSTIQVATDNFADSNKLGQGGFGTVYKVITSFFYIILIWRLWTDGKELECVDPLLIGSSPIEEVVRCIHIGLLCVQEDPADRPTMSDVAVLLGNESLSLPLPEPRQPAIAVGRVVPVDQTDTNPSLNGLTISNILPR